MNDDRTAGPAQSDAGLLGHDALAELSRAHTDAQKIALFARVVLDAFSDYYQRSRDIPRRARRAFSSCDWGESVHLSQERLTLYSDGVHALGPLLARACPEIAGDGQAWRALERDYLAHIEGRYEADLAFAFLHSVRRLINKDEWTPVEYAFAADGTARPAPVDIVRSFPGGVSMNAKAAETILSSAELACPWRDLSGDAALVAKRINRAVGLGGMDGTGIEKIEMIDAGFFRNRGAYLMGRIILDDTTKVPLGLALLNEGEGVFVDAVLTHESDLHNIFSSALANFHVTNEHYHELANILFEIMPRRPLGVHYSTIGYNHVGKVAVMEELLSELSRSGEVLQQAVGFPGTVAIGFHSPSSGYVLKVIRDTPTAQYKWGAFEGVPSVIRKYARVHEINRTGSMLDNIIYYNVKLARACFDPDLLEEILEQAAGTVSLVGGDVVFRQLIVQFRLVPMPVFLERASQVEAERAIISLGTCIRNNAAANIFNRDLDGRNYGVGKFQKVYLFDYDAVQPLTDIVLATNLGREEGEEDVPDWVFATEHVFLPEELEAGLSIDDRGLRRLFREVHGDLLTLDYWERIQAHHRAGRVPRVSTYPDERKLVRE